MEIGYLTSEINDNKVTFIVSNASGKRLLSFNFLYRLPDQRTCDKFAKNVDNMKDAKLEVGYKKSIKYSKNGDVTFQTEDYCIKLRSDLAPEVIRECLIDFAVPIDTFEDEYKSD
uniref:Uncharacterized protein n=1 Tax=viral metagenome TaxID=1070528 RepID=A0A6C0AD62_9ZZZZ